MSKQRRLRRARTDKLVGRITTLERAHKRSLAADILESLLTARKDLLSELQTKLKRKFALAHRLYYEFGNKSGKLLATALQKNKSAHTIHTIKSPTGVAVTRTDHVATQFSQYLSSLYNLPPPPFTRSTQTHTELLEEFLTAYGTPPRQTCLA